MMEYTTIDFIAQMIHRNESAVKGEVFCVRWGALNEDLKTKYRAEALYMVGEWREKELESDSRISQMMADVKTYSVKKN